MTSLWIRCTDAEQSWKVNFPAIFSDKKSVVWFSVCVKIAKAIKFGIIFYIFFFSSLSHSTLPARSIPQKRRKEKRRASSKKTKFHPFFFLFFTAPHPLYVIFLLCPLSPPLDGVEQNKKKTKRKAKEEECGRDGKGERKRKNEEHKLEQMRTITSSPKLTSFLLSPHTRDNFDM